ncbi:TPA: hypothetical protein NES04_003146 [Acinetobacter baumannii]|uniref:hypothetical protein n=1 Tax=Acinetobacter calcoaceticus/baumannii complex TaxID=909768 RepID=UPI0003B829D5|nr:MULTISPECIES: hypothetical protein [Acinetobacter calcoaceticus/baumannii complex]AZC06667.1 hypothetical protein DKE44_015790 [Acinetobacter nosocomialis]EKX8607620.1 hypothetical protein [Acinetobacter baumannii]MCJ9113922.1 hypothetical protein [Acinetobacter baumannii]MDP7803549.1 hypothetical protein [Acinetobacter baumannii]CDG77685.1 hypothetical protein ABICBIBUN_03654 [Acinetobacter baumannii 107m]
MKRQIQARAHAHLNHAQIIEHTPIYDLEAFKQRQKKRKIHQLFKNVIDTFTFLCAVFMTFSILFIGG